MLTFEELRTKAEELASEALHNTTTVRPPAVGLDVRAGYKLHIGEDFIACGVPDDRALQYYGGFEYVDKEFRQELGGYVFYSNESARVADHLIYYQDHKES